MFCHRDVHVEYGGLPLAVGLYNKKKKQTKKSNRIQRSMPSNMNPFHEGEDSRGLRKPQLHRAMLAARVHAPLCLFVTAALGLGILSLVWLLGGSLSAREANPRGDAASDERSLLLDSMELLAHVAKQSGRAQLYDEHDVSAAMKLWEGNSYHEKIILCIIFNVTCYCFRSG